jgi:hypothetical protein
MLVGFPFAKTAGKKLLPSAAREVFFKKWRLSFIVVGFCLGPKIAKPLAFARGSVFYDAAICAGLSLAKWAAARLADATTTAGADGSISDARQG